MIDTGLRDRNVLVTGAGAGIGAAVARAFAAQGARVAVHNLGRSGPEPEGVHWNHAVPDGEDVADLVTDLPGAVSVTADLAAPDGPGRLWEEVEDLLGPVDVLVNNAAHCEGPDTVDTLTAGTLERTYRVNSVAPAVLISQLARRRGAVEDADDPPCVVNVSTDAARAFPGQVAYGSSKAALEALTRGMALDLGHTGIRVNAVAPGPVQTGLLEGETLEHARSAVPLGRVGEPEDIADAVVFLASHQARWITGQVLQVAGGHAL
ncbi:SDR family NAD(P)-dependent oxidoreductase [Nocardiopsis xinjiangensis]|uniref:SDR family NAD(P)-dependent oxidoreductase n=1 Tax=Nocardiopsis xinjiangensis TaxID=124285 RepID=UPI00034A1492|nr:SDR family oxidoreductase [Nocardiopsis xinjiangensis]